MGRVLVGITGWTEPTLIKQSDFYPKDARSAEDRLRFYASQFPIVEVDATYYSPPNERNSVLWIERTPKDFTFNVKAYSMLTQHPTRTDRLYKDLRESLPPELAEKKNLYPDKLPAEVVDEVWQRFHDALMRVHGRDPMRWKLMEAAAAEPLKYDYSDGELAEWTPKVAELEQQARETHVLMNDCYRDYAVKSARQFATLLDSEIEPED